MTNEQLRGITNDMERLHDEVMSRVRFLRRIRAFLSSPASSAVLALLFMLCASIFVSFSDVVRNIMLQGEWGTRFSYTYDAVLHAQIAVQVFAFLTSLSFLVLFTKILFKLRAPVTSIGNYLFSFKFFRS